VAFDSHVGTNGLADSYRCIMMSLSADIVHGIAFILLVAAGVGSWVLNGGGLPIHNPAQA
jgi:hypothetical protein